MRVRGELKYLEPCEKLREGTAMKAKEYLQHLQWLDTVIDQKIRELEDLQAKSTSIGCIDYSKERVQTSPSVDAPFVGLTERIIALNEEINAEIDFFVDEKHRIINQIQGLKNVNHVSILYKRYVEYKKFETIADEMNFTPDYIKHLHGSALRDFERKVLNMSLNNT